MMHSGTLKPWLFLFSLALLLWYGAVPAKESGPEDAVAAPADEQLLARVNGEPVMESQVVRRLQSIHGDLAQYRQDPARWQRMLEAGLEAEIRDRLLAQTAAAEELEVTADELDTALQHSKEMLGEQGYQAMLQQRGATEKDYRDFLRNRLLIDKYTATLFAGITVEDAELRSYYKGHNELFMLPERALLETLSVDQPEMARKIHHDLKAGKAFAEVAGHYLPASDGNNRVMTGWVAIRDLPATSRDAVAASKSGDILEPVEEAGRIRLIRVLEIQPAHTVSFDEARERIRASLLRRRQQQVLDDWYEAAVKHADIDYQPQR